MNVFKRIFASGPKDERLTAQLGPIYKTGFYIMLFGILFDVFTRYNYIAWDSENTGLFGQDFIEIAVLTVACLVVSAMMMRRDVFTDSLRYTESQSFLGTGMIAQSAGVALLVSIAAVGGRLYKEVILFGWENVTWAGDIAMFIVIFVMFYMLFVTLQYLMWRNFRKREDILAAEDEDE